MSDYLSIFIPILAFILSLHPIFVVATQDYFSCKRNKFTFYTNINRASLIAHNKFIIFSSIFLFCIYIQSNIFIFSVPLLVISWISFIRDRFKSIARGLGAPGYFSFFTILSICILQKSHLIESENLLLSYTYMFVASMIYIEFGFIFISAGFFKFLDSRKNSLSFAMGMMNPMWSKIYNNFKLIHRFRYPLNYLGPSSQILGGILLLSGVPPYQLIGCTILFITFISITPFCKLAWLCPSISLISAYLSINLESVHNGNMLIFYTCVIIRGLLSIQIFTEYFYNMHLKFPIIHYFIDPYRKILGVIIWKVFTYDVVKYIGPSPGYYLYVQTSNQKIDEFSLYEFNKQFSSVYHSIAMCSFLSSQNYLQESVFNFRLHKYLKILNLQTLPFLSLSQDKFVNHSFESNPFTLSSYKALKITGDTDDFPDSIKNESDFNSYTKQ